MSEQPEELLEVTTPSLSTVTLQEKPSPGELGLLLKEQIKELLVSDEFRLSDSVDDRADLLISKLSQIAVSEAKTC